MTKNPKKISQDAKILAFNLEYTLSYRISKKHCYRVSGFENEYGHSGPFGITAGSCDNSVTVSYLADTCRNIADDEVVRGVVSQFIPQMTIIR